MIGSLRGRLTSKQAPQIVIECSGVGYEVETPMSTFLDLPELGSDLFLHTHLLVREDAQILYGFATEDDWFDYRLEHDPRFLARIAASRENLRAGKGIRIEDLSL